MRSAPASYWKSAGNFVLINVERARRARRHRRAFAERGILVRDRSRDPGCAGCIRITAGVVRHTEVAVEALEGLCAVP
jgi:histidinol-phosphate aminotransferase